jgi:uncharacterized membrane protein
MKPAKPPLFLAPRRYRRRRLRDAARLLPVLGGFLMVVPFFWGADDAPRPLKGDLVYFFGLWLLLVLAAALLAPALAAEDIEEEDLPEGDPGAEADDAL